MEPLITRPVPWSEHTGGMTTRLSIGDFSRMTYLSVKSLRRYHDLGLLEPAHTDRYTGYRYYEASQVPVGPLYDRDQWLTWRLCVKWCTISMLSVEPVD